MWFDKWVRHYIVRSCASTPQLPSIPVCDGLRISYYKLKTRSIHAHGPSVGVQYTGAR